jgi:Cysteine-rich CPCC
MSGRRTAVWCDVYVRVPGLDRDAHDRLHRALHAADRRLGVIVRGLDEFMLLTRVAGEPAARAYAERVLAEAAGRAGVGLDGMAIEQVVDRTRDLTGSPRRVEAPPGRYRAIELGERGRLNAMHEGPLGEWIAYLGDDAHGAVAGRDLGAVIAELLELPHGRRDPWFHEAIERLAGHRTPLGVRYACPCCDFLTLTEAPSGSYAICPVCRWEDDPVQFRDPDYTGGANRPSLRQARETFRRTGAGEQRPAP